MIAFTCWATLRGPFVLRFAGFRNGAGVRPAIGEVAAQYDGVPRLGCFRGIRGRRLHEIPDRRHVQAGLERRGSLLRIRYAPRRDRSAEHHAQNHIRMPAGVIRNHPAVIRPSKQDHLIQLATAAHQVRIFHLGCQSHLGLVRQRTGIAAAPRIVEHHGAVSHQALQIAREPSGVGNRERTAAVAELPALPRS